MRDLAGEVLQISGAGLAARGCAGAGGLIPDETHFLNALQEIVESGESPSDELLGHYNGDWGGDLKRIYSDYSY
jgi:glutamate--cysteine ligase